MSQSHLCACGGSRRPGQRKCLSCHAEYAREHRKPYRELSADAKFKAACRTYSSMLVKRGHIQRTSCEDCGSLEVQKHHPDYTQPYLVTWLCRHCHLQRHRGGCATDW